MAGGSYTLLVELAAPATVGFGAAGSRDLDAGWYAYTGSALGPGGFARVDRHRDLAAGMRDARHWHVDYLLGHPRAALEDAVTSPGVEAECALARVIRDADGVRDVAGIGASDCDCGTHLVAGADEIVLRRAVERALETVQNREREAQE